MAFASINQASVGGGSSNALAIQSDGIFMPRLSTGQRTALALTTTDAGLTVYDFTLNNLFIWNGAAWESIPGSGDAGANGSVQYNDNGIVSGATNFIYDKATSAVSITGAATVGATLGVTGVSTLTGNAFANGSYIVAGGTPGAFANAALTINNRSNTGDLSLIALGYRPNGTVLNGSAYMGYIITNNSGLGLGDLIFGTRNVTTDTAPTERLRINANGNVVISTGNVVMSNGAGIDFAAKTPDGSGTVGSEVLNDYEEGTWTIGLTFGGGNTGLTTSSNTGRYTKVGRQVTVTGYIELTNKGASIGAASINGLPFTISNQNSAYSAASLRLNGVSYIGAFQAFGAVNTTLIGFEQISILGAVTSLTDANFTNVSGVIFTLTYTV